MPVACLSRRHPAIREIISGGNLLTGRSGFRKEWMNLRTLCAVVSRLSSCTASRGQTPLPRRWSENQLTCTHLWFQRDGGIRARCGGVSHLYPFEVEFLVQGTKEVSDGEIASGFRGHRMRGADGGRRQSPAGAVASTLRLDKLGVSHAYYKTR